MSFTSLKKHLEKRENRKAKKDFKKVAPSNKYRAQSCEEDGYHFASKLERAVYRILKERKLAGEILLIEVQDHVYFARNPDIYYIADFKCTDARTAEVFWVEAKGKETAEWRLKRNLWHHFGPGKLEIYKGTHDRPFLHETIESHGGA